jgi:hypothetical protein
VSLRIERLKRTKRRKIKVKSHFFFLFQHHMKPIFVPNPIPKPLTQPFTYSQYITYQTQLKKYQEDQYLLLLNNKKSILGTKNLV